MNLEALKKEQKGNYYEVAVHFIDKDGVIRNSQMMINSFEKMQEYFSRVHAIQTGKQEADESDHFHGGIILNASFTFESDEMPY